MSQLEFRFLSGDNIGSVIRLPIGSYTLGNTDSCDILSEEHLKEEVAVEIKITEQLDVLVSAVAGNIFIDKKKLTETENLKAGAILLLGMTAVTYRLDDSDWPLITAKDLLIDSSLELAEDKLSDRDNSEINESESSSNEIDTDENNGNISETETIEKKKVTPIKIAVVIGTFLVALILLGMLIFGQSLTDSTEKQELLNIRKSLSDNGFTLVKAEYKNEMYVISGLVEDDEALEKLEQILPDSSHSMLVLVDKISFIAQSVRNAFKPYAIHVTPVFDDGVFRLYGYIRDPYLSNEVTQKVLANLPKSVKIEPHFI